MNSERYEFRTLLFAAQIDPNILEIDLHTENNLETALEKMDKELLSVYKRKIKYCRIIFGIGTGNLKQEVLNSLSKNPLISFSEMDENGGSCFAFFS